MTYFSCVYIYTHVEIQNSKLTLKIAPFVFDFLFRATEGIANCVNNIVANVVILVLFKSEIPHIGFSYLLY
jgi:hypothetical protein